MIAGAVALIEAAGPLDDQAELRQAHRTQPTRVAQFLERAWLLGDRLGMLAEWARWRQVGFVVVMALAALVAISALGTARAVVGQAPTINAVAAFVTLLGLHALTLGLWFLSMLWPRALAGLSLGRLALGLTARLGASRLWGTHAPQSLTTSHKLPALGSHSFVMQQALNRLLQKNRLLPWVFGTISHTIWALAFVLILAVLAFGFAFHTYRLSWETTILSVDFFQSFVQITGWLPSLLGFPVPDAASVQSAGMGGLQSSEAAASQREWAWWLMGCVFTFGLLPRVVFMLLSYARWRSGVARLPMLDTADPYVRAVFMRLDALDPPVVTDPERRPANAAGPRVLPAGPAIPGTRAIIGFELPPEVPWPLPGQPEGFEGKNVLEQRIAGASTERQAVEAALAQVRPWTLVIVVYAASSPDRGTARFFREIMPLAPQCHLLLVNADGSAVALEDTEGTRRWADWLAAESLAALELVDSFVPPQENV